MDRFSARTFAYVLDLHIRESPMYMVRQHRSPVKNSHISLLKVGTTPRLRTTRLVFLLNQYGFLILQHLHVTDCRISEDLRWMQQALQPVVGYSQLIAWTSQDTLHRSISASVKPHLAGKGLFPLPNEVYMIGLWTRQIWTILGSNSPSQKHVRTLQCQRSQQNIP